ncbi:MAG: nuclear transport factor 2 family protein [Vulcanimicrobiaceae bacterium]
MKTRSTIALALLFALTAFGTTMGPARADATQDGIQAAYDAQCKAFIASDEVGVEKYLAPTYVEVDQKGVQTDRADAVKLIKSALDQFSATGCSAKIESISVAGSLATVAVTQTFDGTAPAMSTAPAKIVAKSTDVWAKQADGSWLSVKSTEVSQHIFVNGQDVGGGN